jgi:hypothetical protein
MSDSEKIAKIRKWLEDMQVDDMTDLELKIFSLITGIKPSSDQLETSRQISERIANGD